VPTGWRWIVGLLSVAALVVLARIALRVVPGGSPLDHVALGLIFGGAIGNLIDRLRFGAVVDFVDLHARGYHWPAFNVADSAISVGVVILALRLLMRPAPSTESTS
jgi:signal peptidase II